MASKTKFLEYLQVLTDYFKKTICNSIYNHQSFKKGSSYKYIEDMYKAWGTKSKGINTARNLLFRSTDNDPAVKEVPHSPRALSIQVSKHKYSSLHRANFSSSAATTCDPGTIKDHLEVQAIISAYQARGHLMANLDPLEIIRGKHLKSKIPSDVIIRQHKVPDDLNKVYVLSNGTFIGGNEKALPLREIIKRLETAYCENIGVEYLHNSNFEVAQFMRKRFETPGVVYTMSSEEKRLTLKRLIRSHCFESFLGQKFPNEKRFGLDGCEALIPAIKTMIDYASKHGTFGFNIGMAHRGRLNVLANICRKPLKHVFSQFHPVEPHELGSGDLKYHLGTQVDRINRQTNKPSRLTVVANPSHLECVNPITIGKTYAEQFYSKEDPNKFMALLIHGDAAVCGQGVVYETFHLTELPCHTTHGNIHVVVNNQVGFTTDPRMSRSSEYCTEVAKVLAAPIFHVNADDIEAVIYVMKVATEYKLKFKHSAVVDLVCYRRHGHNEADEPMFTQPIMYKKIAKHKPVMYAYADKLIREKVITEEEAKAMMTEYKNIMEQGFKEADAIKVTELSEWLDSPWKKFFSPDADPLQVPKTAVSKDLIMKIGQAISTPPPNFEIHQKLRALLQDRNKLLSSNKANWAMAEAFAFGSILSEGMNIRLSGQDVQRGTLSHRHHVYHHQSQDKVEYRPLTTLFPGKGTYTVSNSSLSEFGVLGFEYGYSLVSPYTLVLWEAQFGDFSNCAQCIIDQFISSGEAKWGRQSGLVLLLPHGLDGGGPEHSSCRPERFLMMATDNDETVELNMPQQLKDANWFVVNLSTPANYFHALRRQMKLNYRKPLVVLSPKHLLKHPDCVSPLDDMIGDSKFHPYFPDKDIKNKKSVKKVLICCGKVYYMLMKKRKELKLEQEIAIVRIEQLFPFPYADLIQDMEGYQNAKICWVQEEHRNQGCWIYIQPRVMSALPSKGKITYYGRATAAAPATGSKVQYDKEVLDIYKCFTS